MGLEPPYLGDRNAQLERFAEFLVDETPHNVVVTGLRGVGKTVLLQRYRTEAMEGGWLVADREFSEADAEPSMFAQRALADLMRLTRDLSRSRRLKELASGAAERVTDLLGSLTVSYEGIEIGYSSGRRANKPRQMLDDDLRDAMREVGRVCQNSDHTGVILLYDEFHVVKEERGQLTLSALLSATAAVQREGLPIMLVLCGLPTILENLGQAKSYSERMFTVEQIGHLNPPEDRAALMGPAEARGRTFSDDVVDAVMTDTQVTRTSSSCTATPCGRVRMERKSSSGQTSPDCAHEFSRVSTTASLRRTTPVHRLASVVSWKRLRRVVVSRPRLTNSARGYL
ncbi:MAG: ATP-binding protein [Candidatus Dormibacteraeota bacterium]|nr:ATP-binding protein [Candidatus Dormibacteraeota bacterium]